LPANIIERAILAQDLWECNISGTAQDRARGEYLHPRSVIMRISCFICRLKNLRNRAKFASGQEARYQSIA
jgi:hypothetical protein